jgi:hypothetical protein
VTSDWQKPNATKILIGVGPNQVSVFKQQSAIFHHSTALKTFLTRRRDGATKTLSESLKPGFTRIKSDNFGSHRIRSYTPEQNWDILTSR